MRGDIRTRREVHRFTCRYPTQSPVHIGAVRRCRHGIIQEVILLTSRSAQFIAWRDLHPLATPLRWRRASRALRTPAEHRTEVAP
jgi:hypothetical protein